MKSITMNEYLSLNKQNILNKAEEKYFYCNQKDSEIKCTVTLFNLLKEQIPQKDIEGFFFDTDINIVSDFDILRFTESSVVNIELKSALRDKNVYSEVCKKFEKQNRILNCIYAKNIHNILFLLDDGQNCNCIWEYNSLKNSLEPIKIQDLVKLLDTPDVILTNKIENLSPTKYLIDPVTQIDAFINNHYYLTTQQSDIKQTILNKINTHNFRKNMFGIEGGAGSGKTLLILDIIKELNPEPILFIFSGTIKDGHKSLQEKMNNVVFEQAKNITDDILSKYNYIIIDEAQRLYTNQINIIGTFSTNNPDKIIIMAYDLQQKLSPKDNGQLLNSLCDKPIYSLSNKVRSNFYISYFVDKLINTNSITRPSQIEPHNLSNYITVKFFNSPAEAIPWINAKVQQGFKFIKPSGDQNRTVNSDAYTISYYKDTHDVIGNQFSKVVTYIDECLIYEKNTTKSGFTYKKLGKKSSDYYFLENEFYVNCSRATDKLALAVVNNKEVYEYIINKIFHD